VEPKRHLHGIGIVHEMTGQIEILEAMHEVGAGVVPTPGLRVVILQHSIDSVCGPSVAGITTSAPQLDEALLIHSNDLFSHSHAHFHYL
jgi:hypothetical protein